MTNFAQYAYGIGPKISEFFPNTFPMPKNMCPIEHHLIYLRAKLEKSSPFFTHNIIRNIQYYENELLLRQQPQQPQQQQIPTTTMKKKKKPISATVKRLVWNINIGEDIGKAKCMCCKTTEITQMSFNCGHVLAEANDGETIVSNLKPICQNCNSSMGTKNMNEFMKTLN